MQDHGEKVKQGPDIIMPPQVLTHVGINGCKEMPALFIWAYSRGTNDDEAFASMSYITRLATVTDTGEPIAVPKTCW